MDTYKQTRRVKLRGPHHPGTSPEVLGWHDAPVRDVVDCGHQHEICNLCEPVWFLDYKLGAVRSVRVAG